MQLVMSQRNAARRTGPGQTDEVLRSDVGREDRRTDDDPPEVAAGEKVVVSGISAPRDGPPREASEESEVERDGDPVESRHAVRCILSGCILRGALGFGPL